MFYYSVMAAQRKRIYLNHLSEHGNSQKISNIKKKIKLLLLSHSKKNIHPSTKTPSFSDAPKVPKQPPALFRYSSRQLQSLVTVIGEKKQENWIGFPENLFHRSTFSTPNRIKL